MRKAMAGTALVTVLALAPGGTVAAADRLTPAAVEELQQWIAAVSAHVPGRADEWVSATARLSYRRRETLSPAMTLFLAFFEQQKLQQIVKTKGDDEARVVDLARKIGQSPGMSAFLKRAVILHSDAAMLTDRLGGIADSTVPPPRHTTAHEADRRTAGRVLPPVEPVSPLLTNSTFVDVKDGEVIGESPASWNWPFARSLLDVLTSPTVDPFVPVWYHAIAAYMLGNGLYAEATPQLERALAALPGDPLILFDRACYAEVFGLPMQQVVMQDQKAWASRVTIPREDETDAEAEKYFRRALAADPGFVEARVRLARLLDVRGEHEAALTEIDRALSGAPGGLVAFYGRLFAGRAAQSLGRIDEARRHFTAASAMFPDAQSALLAQSQAALAAGDVPAALEPLRILGARPGSIPVDPWWHYHLGAGRDVDDLLRAMWVAVK
jgi:tetratricopeptide (TPR) repeat protein